MAGCEPCPCMLLKTGARIVAIVELVSYSVLLLMAILAVVVFADVENRVDVELDKDLKMLSKFSIAGGDKLEKEELKKILNNFFIAAVIILVYSLIGLVISILLTAGVYKASFKMMLPWMVMESLILCIESLLAILFWQYISLSMLVPGFALSLYFLFIIGAYASELKEGQSTLNNFPSVGQMEMSESETPSQGQNQVNAKVVNISELPSPNYHPQYFQGKPNSNLLTD